MRKLEIVHIISALPFGGVEQNLLRVLPILNADPRFSVSVVCTRERGDLAEPLEKLGVPVTLVKFATRYDPGSLLRLRDHLRARRADGIHCHMRRANTSGHLAAWLAGVPIRVATEHDMCLGKNWRHFLIDRWLLGPLTDAILGVTRGVVEINRERTGLSADKFRVLYLGLDLDRLADRPGRAEARASLGLPAAGAIIGHVGRLHEIKNVPAIVRALAEPALRKATLVIVGDGPERGALEALVKELDLSSRVVFAGWREDLPRVYAALDVMVMASSSEGIATVQMEALATDTPLVSTPVGFALELLTPGVEFISAARPQPDLLAAALAEALRPERAAALRQAGRAAIAAYSIERQAQRMAEIYLELAERHGLA